MLYLSHADAEPVRLTSSHSMRPRRTGSRSRVRRPILSASVTAQLNNVRIPGKIQGIPSDLMPAYDASVDGNRFNITLPTSIQTGSYLLRLEMCVAFIMNEE